MGLLRTRRRALSWVYVVDSLGSQRQPLWARQGPCRDCRWTYECELSAARSNRGAAWPITRRRSPRQNGERGREQRARRVPLGSRVIQRAGESALLSGRRQLLVPQITTEPLDHDWLTTRARHGDRGFRRGADCGTGEAVLPRRRRGVLGASASELHGADVERTWLGGRQDSTT